MCIICCKDFHSWCRAFTATEVLLTVLEAIFLIFFTSFLTFLFLHLITCSGSVAQIETGSEYVISTVRPEENNSSNEDVVYSEPSHIRSTLPQDIECTWIPSEKTKALRQYLGLSRNSSNVTVAFKREQKIISPVPKFLHSTGPEGEIGTLGQSHGEIEDDKKPFIMLLVKMTSPLNITNGCILTVVSEFWTLTAASCIESVNEIDTLHSFIMIDNFKESKLSKNHLVRDMVMHPQYQSINKNYDIAMLKSADKLVTYGEKLLQLPTMINYLLIAIGERLSILGFGNFRTNTKVPILGSLNEVTVHMLPLQQCNTLNLSLSSVVLCARVLYSPGAACNYCAGNPLLLRGTMLVGIMTGIGRCDKSCDLSLYINIALVRKWLNSVIAHD